MDKFWQPLEKNAAFFWFFGLFCEDFPVFIQLQVQARKNITLEVNGISHL